MSIAVVGTGAFGVNHVRTFARIGALSAVCDNNRAALDALKDIGPNVAKYTSLAEALADKNIRGVVLATPAHIHAEQAKQVLAAGKGCLVEKPMSLTVTDAQAILAAAEAAKQPLMVGHLLLYQAALFEMKKRLREGSLGKLRHIQCRRLKLGRVRSQEDVLWSFAPHDVSVALDLAEAGTGKVTVEDASRTGFAYLQPKIEDISHLFIRFGGGVSAHIEASWLWPEVIRTTTVLCSDGTMVWDEVTNKLTVSRKRINPSDLKNIEADAEVIAIPKEDQLELEARDFLKALAGQAEPLANGRNGAAVVEILAKVSK